MHRGGNNAISNLSGWIIPRRNPFVIEEDNVYEALRSQRASRYAYILCGTGYRESSSDMYLSIYWVSNVPLRDSVRSSERRRPKTRTKKKRKRESRGGGEGRKRRSRLNYGSRLKRRIQIDPIYHITWHLYSPFCGRISPLFPGHPIVLLLSLPLLLSPSLSHSLVIHRTCN